MNQISLQTRASGFLPLLSCLKHLALFPAVSQIQYHSVRAEYLSGRTQVAKPLAAGLTAPTTSTRAKVRSRLSAAAISAERRKSAGNKLASTAAEVPHQMGIEKRTESIRQILTKPKSQPSKPHLSKGSFGKPTTKEIVSTPLNFSESDK